MSGPLSALPLREQVAAILTASPEAIKNAWQRFCSGLAAVKRRAKSMRCDCGANTLNRAYDRWPTGKFRCCAAAGFPQHQPTTPTKGQK